MKTSKPNTLSRRLAVGVCVVGLVVAAFLVGRYTVTSHNLPPATDSGPLRDAIDELPPQAMAPLESRLFVMDRSPVLFETKPIFYTPGSIEHGMKADELEHHRRIQEYLRERDLEPLYRAPIIDPPDWVNGDGP